MEASTAAKIFSYAQSRRGAQATPAVSGTAVIAADTKIYGRPEEVFSFGTEACGAATASAMPRPTAVL